MALTVGGRRRKRPGGGPPSTPLNPLEQKLTDRLVSVLTLLSESLKVSDYETAINELSPELLEQLLAENNIDQISSLIEETLSGIVMSGALSEARSIIRTSPRIGQNPFSSLEYSGQVLPSGIVLPNSLMSLPPDVEFLIENPVERMFKFVNQKATDYARLRSAQLVTSISDSNRLAIRQVISRAFTGTRTVDQTARSLRDIVGLHPRWALAVERFKETNTTRLIREGMSTESAALKADEMTQKYRKKLIRRRSEMIARTELQQALNFGREASWQANDRAGLLDPRSEKEWRTAPQGSRYGPPCDECTELRGKRVPWNGSFSNGRSMPPAHPHCRCTAVLVPPTRGLEGLPSQDMGSWIDKLDQLEAEDLQKSQYPVVKV